MLQYVESKLYSESSEWPCSYINGLLSLHASLTNKTAIPRIYLKKEECIDTYLPFLFYSDSEMIKIHTNYICSSIGIGLKLTQTFSEYDKKTIAEYIEDQLSSLCGDGQLIYEMNRFTPFHEDKVLPLLNDDSYLKKTLQIRNEKKQIYLNKFSSKIVNSDLKYYDTYSQILTDKINQKWQLFWLSSLNYIEQNNDIVSKLIIEEDI